MMEEDPQKGKQHMVKIRYRKDGQPIRKIDRTGKPIPRERKSKKERLKERRQEK
ncbi:hypothetical protein FACS189444_4050 [Spirochaetia bacterium]|nr:hypothetical protein FACS189444_4050 [Spirochaetia bacterium]